MMKYGKSISVEELFEPVLCALRCRWRRNQALLLLSLQTGQVAYWQNGEHSWQEQLNEECLADKQRLTDVLREILLARDVEEGAAVLLLPAAAMMYSEQMVLPLMRRRELQAALQWEVQQSVPWPEEGYTYSFEATEFSEAGEQQCRVTFTALQDTSRIELEHLCSSLLLKLQGILLSDMTLDEAAEKWFTGKSLPSIYRQKQRRLQGDSGHFWPLSDKSRLCSFRVSDFGLCQCLGRLLSGAARFAGGRAAISAEYGVEAAYAGKRGC